MDTSLKKAPLLFERYRAHLLHGSVCNPASTRSYLLGLRQFMAYLKEKETLLDFKEVTDQTIRRYQSSFFERTPPFSLSTQSLRLVALKSFFHYLEAEGLLLSNPLNRIEFPKKPSRLPRDILTEAEMKKLLSVPSPETRLGFRDKAILELLYSTGMRSGELSKLKLVDIDEDRGMIRINAGKGNQDRVVPVGEVAVHYLKLYLREGRKKLLLKGETPYLFVSKRGNPIQPKVVLKLVQRHAKRAGIGRHATAHMIRHACATHMLRRKAPIRYIQELLGHRSLETTQIYTRVEITDLKRIHQSTHPRERDSFHS